MIDDTMTANARLPIEALEAGTAGKQIVALISKIEGIEKLSIANNAVEVCYYPQIISLTAIKSEFGKAGIAFAEPVKAKGFLGRFIDRLAESNKKNFGSSKLDCCNLNNKKNGNTVPKRVEG